MKGKRIKGGRRGREKGRGERKDKVRVRVNVNYQRRGGLLAALVLGTLAIA